MYTHKQSCNCTCFDISRSITHCTLLIKLLGPNMYLYCVSNPFPEEETKVFLGQTKLVCWFAGLLAA